VKAGRTFATNGPLVRLDVNGRGPGDELRLDNGAPVAVRVGVQSIAPIERLEIVVNGEVAVSRPSSGRTSFEFDANLAVPDGGWIAARAIGPSSRYIADSYAYAHTTPVYVVRRGRTYVSAADAAFLGAVVDAIWARASRASWRSPADRDAFKREIDAAKARYQRLAGSR
jgi:hypothetical protein